MASGQLINLDKSGIIFSTNTPPLVQHEICFFLGIPAISGNTKYLGLPSFWGRSKSEAYGFLMEKAVQKM